MIFLILLVLSLILPQKSQATNHNIFGLHLTQLSDLGKAEPIINSQGGDWGWVTIVLAKKDLDKTAWQDFFNLCRVKHIQPIIRLATVSQGASWARPERSDIDNFANFLNELNWPTKTLPVVLFNEVNHPNEWGGQVDIKGYADIAIYALDKFQQTNPNFLLMGSALDLASPSKGGYKNASDFYRELWLYKSEYFQKIEALSSHSYPNHGFLGLPTDKGKVSVRGYQWEQEYLHSLGVKQTYPVYITETGWPSRELAGKKSPFYTRATTAKLLAQAFDLWSKDEKIVAVTPFIFNYPYPPFATFSWVDTSEKLYPEYAKFQEYPKSENQPEQVDKIEYLSHSMPILIFANTAYSGQIIIKNTGQAIWQENGQTLCFPAQTNNQVEYTQACSNTTSPVLPGHNLTLKFDFKILAKAKDLALNWDKLEPIKIQQVVGQGQIYQSQPGLLQNLQNYFSSLLKRFK